MTTNEWHKKGQLSADGGRYREALEFFQKAAQEEPKEGIHLSEAGIMALYLRHREQAFELSSKAMALSPANLAINANHAVILANMDQRDEAVATFERVIKENPTHEFLHFRFGQTLVLLGDLARAEQEFRTAIQLNPERGHNYYQLSRLTKLQQDDPCFVALESQMQHVDQYTTGRQSNFRWAYGHALQAQGRHEEAFEQFVKANATFLTAAPQDGHNPIRTIIGNIKMIDQPAIDKWHGRGNRTQAPIFIVSMPRSGSTLVEQILSHHPHVISLEERGVLETAQGKVGGFSFYHHDESFTQKKLLELGETYLATVREAHPDIDNYARFTDKSLTLFQHVGLLHLTFPNAKFVYVKRNPIDIALSIFSLRFAGIDYAYDLAEIGRRLRLFHETMEDWKKMLPAGTICEVQYEDVVNDLEGEVRKLLEFCGLPWLPSCLKFHENKRLVTTSSNMQVRRPLYRSSLKHWRPSDEQLQPLYNGLGFQLASQLKE